MGRPIPFLFLLALIALATFSVSPRRADCGDKGPLLGPFCGPTVNFVDSFCDMNCALPIGYICENGSCVHWCKGDMDLWGCDCFAANGCGTGFISCLMIHDVLLCYADSSGGGGN